MHLTFLDINSLKSFLQVSLSRALSQAGFVYACFSQRTRHAIPQCSVSFFFFFKFRYKIHWKFHAVCRVISESSEKFSNSDVDSPTEGENDTPAADTAPQAGLV